jgi:integrase
MTEHDKLVRIMGDELMQLFNNRLACQTETDGLSELTKEILAARREPSTYLTYRREWTRFCHWLADNQNCEYPITPYIAGAYLVWLHGQNYGRSTIRKAITVLGLAHDANDNPCEDRTVREIIRGIMRKDRRPTKKARPLALAELVAICDQFTECGDWRSLRDRALLSVGWMAALRSAELSALDWSDVIEVEAGIELTIRESKTNKSGEAEIVGLPLLHDAYHTVCPVRNLRAIKPLIEAEYFDREPVFLSQQPMRPDLYRDGQLLMNSGERISARAVSRAVERGAKLARLEAHYSSHCLRRGFATYAASRGVSELTIMRHGRWKSSAVAQGYIERAKLWNDNPIKQLLG